MINLTPLCEIAYKYGTDKCPQIRHTYTPAYYELFKDRISTIKKVLELGIGYPETMTHVTDYKSGASLKMWRDFFPNAQIYGADVESESMINDTRISSFICDETKEEDIVNLLKLTGKDIDIFIDDGSHKWQHQSYLAKTILPMLNKNVTYIIEDVGFPGHIINELKEYNCEIPDLLAQADPKPKNKIIIVKNKQ